MTSRERVMIIAFFWVLIATATAIGLLLAYEAGDEATRSEASYRAALEKLPIAGIDEDAILERITQLRVAIGDRRTVDTTAQKSRTLTDVANEALRLMDTHGFQPIRYQVVGSGSNASIEFMIRCSAIRFFSFLSDASDSGRGWEIPFLSLRSISDTDTLEVTVRIAYAL